VSALTVAWRMAGFTLVQDDDGWWLREHATGELCGPYDSHAEAIADRRDEPQTPAQSPK
jgi:hypothetical protein